MRFFVMGGGCYGTFYARQLLRARAAGALRVDEIGVVDAAPRPAALDRLGSAPPLRHYHESWDDFLDRTLAAYDLAASGEPPDDGGVVPEAAGAEGVELSPEGGRPLSSRSDILVTPPFTPHLALAWLLRTLPRRGDGLRWRLEPFALQPETPFRHQADGGPLLLSHADWICPVNCIEPERCPKIRAPRAWDMDATAGDLASSLAHVDQPVDVVELFHCHHIAYGVGGYPLARLPAAAQSVLRAAARGRERRGLVVRALVGTISHCHGALNLLTAWAGMEREADLWLFPPMADTSNPDGRVP